VLELRLQGQGDLLKLRWLQGIVNRCRFSSPMLDAAPGNAAHNCDLQWNWDVHHLDLNRGNSASSSARTW